MTWGDGGVVVMRQYEGLAGQRADGAKTEESCGIQGDGIQGDSRGDGVLAVAVKVLTQASRLRVDACLGAYLLL